MSHYTLHYRLKDSTSASHLSFLANNVNLVWNYCNETSINAVRKDSKWLSGFDLNCLTAGTSKELCLNSTTIQSVCEEYACRRRQFKKLKLRWRSKKKSLGWIPFKGNSIKYLDNMFVYNKRKFKFFDSKYKHVDLNNLNIKCGSFNQDSRGKWYINLVIEVDDIHTCLNHNNSVGVDLGLNSIATTSDGEIFENNHYFKQLSSKLAKAQRANKKKLAKAIHSKIKNQRKDFTNKLVNSLITTYDVIVVGDLYLKSSKSTLDAAFGSIKTKLLNKAIRLGKLVLLVNEAWTTQQCSCCEAITGPKGLNELSVREWVCSSCGASHHRDYNAATNILRLGHKTLYPGIHLF